MEDIDEELYSRQLYVLGHDALFRLAQANILVSGMGGLGVEITKNLVLIGVKSVTIHDQKPVTWNDLSSQFYVSEDDLSENRAEAAHHGLAGLNNDVQVVVHTADLTNDFIKKFEVVVLTDSSLDEEMRLGDACHEMGVHFISADTKGLFGKIFCDFGEKFTVSDVDGEDYEKIKMRPSSITRDEAGVLTVQTDERHRLADGDQVTFSEVEGMQVLNGCDPISITVTGSYSFTLEDVEISSAYIRGGVVKKVKVKKTLSFKPISKALEDPEFIISDFSKCARPPQLHIAFQSLHHFVCKHGYLPKNRSKADAEEFISIAKEINARTSARVDAIDEDLFEEVAYAARGNLCPIQSVIGGMAAQEVMKACTGKFMPIVQFFYFDALECLPEDKSSLTEVTCKPDHCRYDGQTAVFGSDFQEKIGSLKYFLVGAGAIGCEILKNWSMMGIAAGPEGQVFVADKDSVEKSNLSHQFLFRSSDMQNPKSEAAVAAVQRMNPETNIVAHVEEVNRDMENMYTSDFYEGLDGIVSAVDNTTSRLFLDEQCIRYRRPHLDAGILGTKGHVQVILPFLTEAYSSVNDPVDIGNCIPMKTVATFPAETEHAIMWATEIFHNLFTHSTEEAKTFIKKQRSSEELIEHLSNPHNMSNFELLKMLPCDMIDCIKWAINFWHENFENKINKLLENFPVDKMNPAGEPFWLYPKRCPHPLQIDINNETHFNFIVAASQLRAKVFGIAEEHDRSVIKQMVDSILAMDASVSPDLTADTDDQINRLLVSIPSWKSLQAMTICPLQLQINNDDNHHMDFIINAVNLHAENYDIPASNRMQCKLIAGKLVPSLITTSSVIAGLLNLEVYKMAQGNPKRNYKNGFINLALPLVTFSEPASPFKQKYYNNEFTLWDVFDVQGEMTLREFLQHFETHHRLTIQLLAWRTYMLYASFMRKKKMSDRMDLTISQIIEVVSKKPIPEHYQDLILTLCADEVNSEEEDIEVPDVRYRLLSREQTETLTNDGFSPIMLPKHS